VRLATLFGAEERSRSCRLTSAIAANPLTRTTHADTGGLGRRRQRPALINDPTSKLAPAAPAERRVTVQISVLRNYT
jgi:hypothetical protein